MTTRAVVFDLFGTLVTYPPGAPHVQLMSDTLGIDFQVLHAAWRRLRPLRDAGEMDTLEALRRCCAEMGADASDERLQRACTAVADFFRDLLTPRPGAIAAIERLRARDLRIGLVSDSNIEVARAWPASSLASLIDAAVFSCVEHVRKPDPALYRAVTERLGVAPSECLYVGNGDGHELAGATRFGMRAALYTAAGELPGGESGSWAGARVDDLAEVVVLL